MKKRDLCMVLTTPLHTLVSGKHGDIYRVPRGVKAPRILKVEKNLEKCSRNMKLAIAVNNAAADISLAPRIYNSQVCTSECRLYMDYIPSVSMFSVMNKGQLTESILKSVFTAIRKLHTVAVNGHGDLNFGNILLSGSKSAPKVYFIDFTTYYGVYSKRDPVLDVWQMLYYANRTGLYKRYPFLIPSILAEIGRYYQDYTTLNEPLDLQLRFIRLWMTLINQDTYDTLFYKKTVLNEHLLEYIIFFNHHANEVERKFGKFYDTYITNNESKLSGEALLELDDLVVDWTDHNKWENTR